MAKVQLRDEGRGSVEEVLRIGRLLKAQLDERLERLPSDSIEGYSGLEARRIAVRQVLGEVREMDTESLRVRAAGTRSRWAAQDLAHLASEFYPSDWLVASNRVSAVRADTRMLLMRFVAVIPSLLGVAVAAVALLEGAKLLVGFGWPVTGDGEKTWPCAGISG